MTTLRTRSLKDKVGSSFFSFEALELYVPQGLCAVPVLYSAYASTMEDVISSAINIREYADDHVFIAI